MNPRYTFSRRKLKIDWSGAIYAGLIAGAVFFFLQIFLLWAGGLNIPWEFPQKIAAIVLGPDVLLQPATSGQPTMLVGLVVHMGLSILYTAFLALCIRAQSTGTAIFIGIGFGLVLYLLNYYVAVALFPWFAEARHWATVVGHAVFGGTSAWVYKAFTQGPETTSPE